ncbi:5_t:CDS:2, partial [Acaulospora morrowiae]
DIESEESESSTSSATTISKKKKRIPKLNDLDADELRIAETITLLRKKYHCTPHDRPCYIQNYHHLRLTPSHLRLWAHEILHGGSIENPPTLPLFGISSSKELRTPPQPTQQPYLPLQPQYYAYIPSYPSLPPLSPQSHSAVSSPLKK